MKLAVIKFGGRMNANADGAVGGEVMAAIDLLVRGDNEVHYYTHINNKDVALPGAHGQNIEYFGNDTSFDALIVINGNINYYGGAEPELEMKNLRLLNSFPGKVFYIMFDPMLPLRQHWKGVSNKQEKYKWNNKYSKEEIEIVRDDIIYISQPYDLTAVREMLDGLGVPYKDVLHYPLYKMHLVFYDRLLKIKSPSGEYRTVDLTYGGTFRNKKREDKLIKFYFGYPCTVNVEIFGKIKLSDFNKNKIKGLRAPLFTGQIKHNLVRRKMSRAYATVSIGDKWYEGRNLAQRIYESILSNCITFIDEELDPQHVVYGEELPKFYVKDRDQVLEQLLLIKIFEEKFDEILDQQYDIVKIDKQEFVNGLTNLIGNNL